MGNKDEPFVEERKYFLNQFLKQLCGQRYLASTPEVQIFLRAEKSVRGSLQALEKATTTHILNYYKEKLKIK